MEAVQFLPGLEIVLHRQDTQYQGIRLQHGLPMDHSVKPVLQALLVADHVYQDVQTGKKIIVGVFHEVRLVSHEEVQSQAAKDEGKMRVPASGFQVGSPFAYASLTSLRGEQNFILRYVDLSDDTVHFQYEITMSCDDPLAPVDMIVPLPPLPTEKPGVFALELLLSNGEPLGRFRITVKKVSLGEI